MKYTQAKDYLRQSHPRLGILIDRFPDIKLIPSKDYFSDLASAIVCQQLSDKAGAAIWKRFTALFDSPKIIPEAVAEKTVEQLRRSGISHSKAQYMKNVAVAFLDKTVTPEKFSAMSDSEIIGQLIQIKGVGTWTAEMFCIFSLGREDIFSVGDLGLSNALYRLYGRKKPFTKAQMERIARAWSPYRSYASLLLWKSLEK
jgi:DNA-3-methyladenine glycosylase II